MPITFCLSVLYLCYDCDLVSGPNAWPFLYSGSHHNHSFSRVPFRLWMSAHRTGYDCVRGHRTFYEVMSNEILLASLWARGRLRGWFVEVVFVYVFVSPDHRSFVRPSGFRPNYLVRHFWLIFILPRALQQPSGWCHYLWPGIDLQLFHFVMSKP